MGKAGKVAAAITTILTTAVVATSVEVGTYLVTGGLNPINSVTFAELTYFDEYFRSKNIKITDTESHDAVGKFLTGRVNGKDCHLVYEYQPNTIPIIEKNIPTKKYKYVSAEEELPEIEIHDGSYVSYDYAAARQYLKDMKSQIKLI